MGAPPDRSAQFGQGKLGSRFTLRHHNLRIDDIHQADLTHLWADDYFRFFELQAQVGQHAAAHVHRTQEDIESLGDPQPGEISLQERQRGQ
jgi:hypothetical protein